MNIYHHFFIICSFFAWLALFSLPLLKIQPVQAKTNKKETSKQINKSTGVKKKQQRKTNRSTHSPLIETLTNELDFLNKKLAPRLREKEAVNYIQDNKNKKAIDLLESLEDTSARSLLILAQAYENTGDYKNQIRILKKLVKKYKKNGTYLIELAKGLRKLYFKTGLFKHREEAITHINETLTLQKKYHENAHLEMLKLLKYKEDSDETNYAILKLLQTLIREFGVKRSYVKDICKYFYINKFYSQSLSGCKKAMKYDPKEPSNYIYHALSMEETEDIEKHLNQAVQKFPKVLFVRIRTGQFFIEQKEYKSALPHFNKALKIQSNSAEGQIGLAQSLFHNGKEKESYKHFFKACMLDKPQMLWAFKQAKSILNQKSKFKLASTFEQGITKCFLRAPKKINSSKNI